MQKIKIPCVIEKQDPNSDKMGRDFIRFKKINNNIGNCVLTREPHLYVNHSNMCIEIQRVTKDEIRKLKSKQ